MEILLFVILITLLVIASRLKRIADIQAQTLRDTRVIADVREQQHERLLQDLGEYSAIVGNEMAELSHKLSEARKAIDQARAERDFGDNANINWP